MLTVKQKATRFRVLRFCKSYYEKNSMHPTANEVSVALGISASNAKSHMRDLASADGIATGLLSQRKDMHNATAFDELGSVGPNISRLVQGKRFDENYIPLDRLLCDQ